MGRGDVWLKGNKFEVLYFLNKRKVVWLNGNRFIDFVVQWLDKMRVGSQIEQEMFDRKQLMVGFYLWLVILVGLLR